MQAASRIPIYTKELTVAREDAEDVLEAMLHVICFLRMLGLLQPASETIAGVDMPRVPAASVATRLRDTVSNLFLQLDKRVDERDGLEDVCVDVVVGWHKPPSTSERTSRASSPDRYSSSQASHPKSYAAFQSPYSWLASALAGSRTPSRGESRERDGAHVLVRDTGHDGIDSDTFEQWVLSLRVHCGSGVPRDALAAALTDFTWTAMAFAGEHQAELPAIVDAGLVPFPYTIDGSIRA